MALVPTAPACHARHLCHAPVHFDGRTCLYRPAAAAGARLYQGRLRSFCPALSQALHIFLGRTAALGPNLVAGPGQKFTLPGLVRADVLGTRTRFASAQTGRLAVVLADCFVPIYLLSGLSRPALPSSH